MFGRKKEFVSMAITWMVNHIFDNFSCLLQFDQIRLTPQKLKCFAESIHAKGSPLSTVYGFIDGTVRPISRPTIAQRMQFNGHHRTHALKF
jgi:hypothetical protein